ncbi:DUF1212-domain-containing protein [Auriscalpium vulgare]|uniref:DUF1212-domain-containing protein n=1 Tax=Auriscalpium vulgare TaxID=40419 RepID=A0ACB8RMP1_9AGAM|nr:DUF1212-domain-containing protein [Auriscalpium vulgare]
MDNLDDDGDHAPGFENESVFDAENYDLEPRESASDSEGSHYSDQSAHEGAQDPALEDRRPSDDSDVTLFDGEQRAQAAPSSESAAPSSSSSKLPSDTIQLPAVAYHGQPTQSALPGHEKVPSTFRPVAPRADLLDDDPDQGPSIGWLQDDSPLDPDDPRVTGVAKSLLDDPEDMEEYARQSMSLRDMSYRKRRKEQTKLKVMFNDTSVLNRQRFIIKLSRALMTYGAPSHRIESQLVSAARILQLDAEFIHLPNVVLVCFGEPHSVTHFIKCGGRLALGKLHEVHQVYRQVVHDEISATQATTRLSELMKADAIYGVWTRCFLAFLLSAQICPLAFGGSMVDMWIAAAGSFALCALQLTIVAKSALYANVFEVTVAMMISFLARGLSSIKSDIFCYTAISSAGIVGILPGYLIRKCPFTPHHSVDPYDYDAVSSSVELASKNILTGSVKMVYALIYALFLGFGLQIGSDLYLLFDRPARHALTLLATSMDHTVFYSGMFISDNATNFTADQPLFGEWSFTNITTMMDLHIIDGCFRPPHFPWYLQPFPFWTEFILVPGFSIILSLTNLQPWRTWDMLVMVLISCAAYAVNKTANHFIFNRSDVVSAIGASVVGLLGSIYSRKFGGTAFTTMVTGVLFLVPSCLSQVGGLTASGNGIDIGGAMIAVAVGITVGLFMSQAIVAAFGTRKNTAIFSF